MADAPGASPGIAYVPALVTSTLNGAGRRVALVLDREVVLVGVAVAHVADHEVGLLDGGGGGGGGSTTTGGRTTARGLEERGGRCGVSVSIVYVTEA